MEDAKRKEKEKSKKKKPIRHTETQNTRKWFNEYCSKKDAKNMAVKINIGSEWIYNGLSSS